MGFSKLFSYKSVDMPNKSGHDEFHRRYFSGDVGTLTPSFVDFLIPGDKVDLSGKFEIQLPPMATDFYGRINLRTELFYVPCRILFGGWKDFITYPAEGIEGPAPDDPNYHAKYLPGASLGGDFAVKRLVFESSGNIGSALQLNGLDGTNFPVFYTYENTKGVKCLAFHSSNYISWYNTYSVDRTSANNKLKTVFGPYWLDVIEKLNAAADSGDVSIIYDAPSSFTADFGPGSLLDFLGFKVNSENKVFTDEYLIAVTRSIAERMQAVYDDTTIGNNQDSISLIELFYVVAQTGSFNSIFFDVYLDNNYEETTGDENIKLLSLLPPFSSTTLQSVRINNILPAVCYHKIYDDWYRDPRIMKPLFPSALRSYGADTFLENIAYIPKFSGGFNKKYYSGDQLKFYDGKSLFDLRQRLWQKDYFTTMTAQPQAGDSMKVSFDVANDSGEFTIASLRVANAMQQWLERNNLVSPRYGDVMFAQYGVYPSDAITDRSIYLGSQTIEVYNKAVYQQGSFNGNGANPFDSVGAKYGAPVAMDSGSFCNNYEVKEHGFLMALTSLVPEASYGSGTRRFWHYDTIADIAFPLLQGVGDQEVYAREIIDTYSGEGDKTVIGYQERYIEYKFIEDSVHGRLRDGENLSSFMLQRTFSEAPELGADFLEIPKDYLNQVGAVNADVSDYGYWGAVAWDYRKVSSLSSANATPTLGRMVDVHTISVPKGGTRL